MATKFISVFIPQPSRLGCPNHGKSGTRVYLIWQDMFRRCYDQNKIGFKNYGGRGIKVCERWRKFVNFYRDMGEPPPRHEIDRINNDGHYEPGNCRWASLSEQARNRRNNVRVTLNGETKIVTDWCRQFGLDANTVFHRLYLGWDAERALTTRIRKFSHPRRNRAAA